ncbi:MAG: hypothetical protein AB7O97_16330 [Planctomycetota bacterium]
MFPDLFLPNAALCALGIAVAVYWLRTGMVGRGVALLAGLLVAADLALLARFVFDDRPSLYRGALWTLQVAATGGVAWLGFALARRRWSPDARRRDELFATGYRHYLRGEWEPAARHFRRLLRADPWDTAARVAAANTAWRLGRVQAALRGFRTARRLDRARAYVDFIAEQERRVRSAPIAPRPARSQRASSPPAAAPRHADAAGR